MLRQILAIGVLLGLSSPVHAQTRSEIPIREVVLSDGQHRYTVPITVGGTLVEAGLDTGSTGVRFLPGVVREQVAEHATGRHSSYSYANGIEFDGSLVEGDVTFGVSGRLKFEQIEKIHCRPGLKTCQLSSVKPEEFRIESGGLPNEGFKAIVGLSMGRDESPNPLMALGVKRWIVELPRPGEDKPGRIVLNPTDAEVTDYKLFHIDSRFSEARGAQHDAVEGCVVNKSTKRADCGATILDSGAPWIQMATPEFPDKPAAWGPQTPATFCPLPFTIIIIIKRAPTKTASACGRCACSFTPMRQGPRAPACSSGTPKTCPARASSSVSCRTSRFRCFTTRRLGSWG